MDNKEVNKRIYEAIDPIRLKKKRPYPGNIIPAITGSTGLDHDVSRKHLEFLVASGAIYTKLATKGEDTYYVYHP